MRKIYFIISAMILAGSLVSSAGAEEFLAGKPIWPEGREKEKNLFVGFRAIFKAHGDEKVILRACASTVYRAYVNGTFCGYGPARGPHDYYRMDEWDITPHLQPEENIVAIEVAGYNVNSYYLLDQPSFLQAEVVSEGTVFASTGTEGMPFEALILRERVQKVQRYSFQRPFIEFYAMSPNYDRWRRSNNGLAGAVVCNTLPEKRYLPRRVPYPAFSLRQPLWDISCGKIVKKDTVTQLWKDRSLTRIDARLGGYEESDLAIIPSIELQMLETVPEEEINQPFSREKKIHLSANSYHIVDVGANLTGFLGAKIICRSATRLYLTFDEILSRGDVNFRRLSCVNGIGYELAPGTYEVESFEPYTLRYVKCIVLEGSCSIENIYLREYANPDVYESHFIASDERLNRLFEAGRETYRQNALDVFMDCPSRERAGWLCDSFFTSRAGYALSGNSIIEKNFFENFLLPEKFAHLPEGMLPMCYPADHYDGIFIPNWALWFVLQFEEYVLRSGDSDMRSAMKPKIMRLFDYFKPFENEYGLLEKLESWVFVEWSKANSFVQDVNYPSNMLYAAALEAAGRLYGLPELIGRAEMIRKVILKQSFDGEFFVDNAVRKNGILEVTGNRTEVCQYFAFYFNVASPESQPHLWAILVNQFGPQRKERNEFPEIYEANSFVGNMLRMEILSRNSRCQQILNESIDYLLYMAEKTGTLWENVGDYASCNHGFASHIVNTLYRDVLGIYRIDAANKVVYFRFTDVDLKWCGGRIPLKDGAVELSWRKEGDCIFYHLNIPAGYGWKIDNLGRQEAIQAPY